MEDALLDRHIFKGRTGGIFLEIGGLDGLKFSNSWYFEQSLCWRGILIEGLPSNFDKMKENRPLAINIGQAVCSQAGVVSYVAGNNSATAGLETHMDKSFKQMWHESSTKFNVCCNPMSRILQPIKTPYLNLLSIDVEGAEEIILKTIDWTSLPVEVVVVETDSRFMEEDKVDRITNFLLSKGLTKDTRVTIKHSTVYRNLSFDLESIDVNAWADYARSQVLNISATHCKML
jgi:FkbM family methyltransferase